MFNNSPFYLLTFYIVGYTPRLMNISGKIIQSYTDANTTRPSAEVNLNAFGGQVAVELVNETVLVKQEVPPHPLPTPPIFFY